MKASELRIGNCCMCNNKDYVIELEDFRDILEDVEEIRYYKPIPLTEEWLHKLGFYTHQEKGRYGYKWYIPVADYNYVVERDFNEYQSHFFGIEYTDCPDAKDDYVMNSFSFDLEYVHQLQNLYFALTGKELEFNQQ